MKADTDLRKNVQENIAGMSDPVTSVERSLSTGVEASTNSKVDPSTSVEGSLATDVGTCMISIVNSVISINDDSASEVETSPISKIDSVTSAEESLEKKVESITTTKVDLFQRRPPRRNEREFHPDPMHNTGRVTSGAPKSSITLDMTYWLLQFIYSVLINKARSQRKPHIGKIIDCLVAFRSRVWVSLESTGCGRFDAQGRCKSSPLK